MLRKWQPWSVAKKGQTNFKCDCPASYPFRFDIELYQDRVELSLFNPIESRLQCVGHLNLETKTLDSSTELRTDGLFVVDEK